MNIVDDTATLWQGFGGFWGSIHTIAVLVFAFPYLWFLLRRWQDASFAENADMLTIPIWEAFFRYVFNGGKNWGVGYEFNVTFVVFLLALALNALRVVLLIKVKRLERYEEVTGVPASFSLSDVSWLGVRWGVLSSFMKWAGAIFILITMYNTYHFSQMGVPLP